MEEQSYALNTDEKYLFEGNEPSVHLQNVVVAGLSHNSYMLALVKDQIQTKYFRDNACKVMYQALLNYYKDCQDVPKTLDELLKMADDAFVNFGTTKEQVLTKISNLFEAGEKIKDNEKFLTKCAEELIIKCKTNQAASDALDLMKESKSGEIDTKEFVRQMIESLSVSLEQTSVYTMSDLDRLEEVRKEAYGDGNNNKVIKSCMPSINDSFQYGGYQIGTLNMIVAPPGTGKTSYLINEACYAAKQNKHVLHVYLGDMIRADHNIRYLSCLSGMLQNDVARMTGEQQAKLIKTLNETYPGIMDRISCMCFATGDKTVNEVIEIIKKDQAKQSKNLKKNIHYDFINIDYADNFQKTMDNNYVESGYIYERLAWFGRTNQSVMMVASQPKLGYWSEEIIPMEGAAESSKKQHVSDSVFSMNRAARGFTFGTIFASKIRRGTTGQIIRYQSHWEVCRIDEIDETTYKQLRHDSGLEV